MTKHTSIGLMVAASAVIGFPVLAQTTPIPPRPSQPGSPIATPAPPPAPMVPRYLTADHKVKVGKVVGATVYNSHDESIGTVRDVLMTEDEHKVGTAVVATGTFLGMGGRLVSVPFDQLKIRDNKVEMPDGTTEALKALPEYTLDQPRTARADRSGQ